MLELKLSVVQLLLLVQVVLVLELQVNLVLKDLLVMV